MREPVEIKKGIRCGRLTVVEDLGSSTGYHKWRCICDCGNIVDVQESHLRTGHTKSCGCLRKEMAKSQAHDLTGRTFGRLTVLEPVGNGYWKCRCSCGKEKNIYKEYLTMGSTRSCGCLGDETRKENMKKAIHFMDGTCVEKIADRSLPSNNTTGYRGVCRLHNGKYRSFIGFKNKKYSLGTYSSIEEAVEARKEKEEELFGSFLEEYYREIP